MRRTSADEAMAVALATSFVWSLVSDDPWGALLGLVCPREAFARRPHVERDGAALTTGSDYQVKNPEEILVVLTSITAGTHTLTVQNPEGAARESTESSFTP